MFKLEEALAAVATKPEFSIKDRDDYVVIDYNLNSKTTFVGKDDAESKILLNLRGTAFDKETGNIIRLGYHKFFNYGEFPEQDKNLDFSKWHDIKQKLDGSCIFPIYTNSYGFELGTRAGVTDVSRLAENWVCETHHRYKLYNEFINFCRKMNVTPIFEFCSRSNRVVIDYPVSNLILTGVRRIDDGSYLTYSKLVAIREEFGIPIVSRENSTTDEQFADLRQSVSDLVGDEGVVIQFEDGHMLKIKSSDYCLKHKALDSLKFEKDVLLLALESKIDDVLPLLDTDTKKRVEVHVATFMCMFYEAERLIVAEFVNIGQIDSQKEFALKIKDSPYRSFLFNLRSGKGTNLLDYCKKQCGTQEKTKDLKKFLNFNVEY